MHRSIIFQGCCWEDLSRTISSLFSFFPMHYFFSLRKLEDALFTSSVLKFHNNVLGVGFFFFSICCAGYLMKMDTLKLKHVSSCSGVCLLMCLLISGIYLFIYLRFMQLMTSTLYFLGSLWTFFCLDIEFLGLHTWNFLMCLFQFSIPCLLLYFLEDFLKICFPHFRWVYHFRCHIFHFYELFFSLRWFCFKEHCFCFMGEMSYFSENSNELVLEVLLPRIVLSP